MDNKKRIYQIVSQIPKGKVLTYKLVAEKTKTSNPRLIGRILHQNPNPDSIPCHRVVRQDGRLASNFAFGGLEGQKTRLMSERVEIVNNKVDLRRFLWKR